MVEQAQYAAGIAGDLERSLASIDGVLGARVHLSIAEQQPLAPVKRPSASVLLRCRDNAPVLSDDQVRALVAGAVTDLEPAQVAVIKVFQPVSPSVPAAVVKVGAIGITRSSLTAARVFGVGIVALVLGQLVGILVLYWRLRKLRTRDQAV